MKNLHKKINILIIITIIALIINIIFNLIYIESLQRTLNDLNNKLYIEKVKMARMTSEDFRGIFDIMYQKQEYIPIIEIEEVKEPIIEEISLGDFKITAYCPCKKCCGKWSYEVTGVRNKTSSGTYPTANNTVAADTNILPYGSKIKINDIIYTVEDTGSGVKGKHIDIYFDDHNEALNSGLSKSEVFLIKGE